MKKIKEIFTTHKYALIWTICYIAVMWTILRYLFNFDMFSILHWHHLIHANLRGFPGFVFGILILAALPLYIATTTLIIRTKKPLLTIPIPTFIKNIWNRMQPTLITPPEAVPPEEKESEPEKSESETLPDELPSELRTAYIRAKMNITPEQRSAFNQPTIKQDTDTPAVAPIDSEPAIDEIPLPTDFEISEGQNDDFSTTDFSQMSVPTFSDVTFGDTPETASANPIAEYLDSIGKSFETQDDLIITDKHVIATHSDDDFWVCDDESWFATGKQIKSPITTIKDAASEKNLTPVLYLASTNIMDLENMRKQWTQDGIVIIESPDKIPE